MVTLSLLKKKLTSYNKALSIKAASPDMFVFEERVRLLCFYCEKYNRVHTCPPKIPKLDYKKVLNEYKNCAVVYCKMSFTSENFKEVRSRSTNLVHRGLLYLEKVLRDNDHPLVLSLIGGSCKLCKGGCDPERCRNPYLARIPVEATGINLIESLKKIGIKIKFPVIDNISRYGLLFW